MRQETPENLRWAAIQLLENYRRCGMTNVPRGTNRFADAWGQISANQHSSSIQPQSEKPATVSSIDAASSPPLAKPLPPMPVVPLRSDANTAKAKLTPAPTFETRSLELAEPTWGGPPLPETDRRELFDTLRERVRECKICEELACSRKQTVFGVGNLMPRVVFFGEAPGADEDRQGEPFVGAAGQLLNKIMVAAQMKREEVYILNSLKCRPPGNRTPVDVEIENCRAFFEAQLDVLQPEFIVCLGAVAVRAVLQTTESVGRLRGRFHRYRKARVLVTYHPAYLLRNESAKKFVWDDMKMLMREMGLKLPNEK